tara:strand:+ start:971 stop:2128 length:1158 start_codon:yes stop_codon:yes gene_type:complete
MTNIPDKCSRCGAPIDWEKGSSSSKCNYCGKINYLNEFNSWQSKKYSFFSSIKNNSQKYLLAIKKKFKKDLKNQDLIPADLIYKYILSGKEIAKRRESKILLSALPIGLLILGINSYINSPLRVHNKKIKDACNQSRIESINYGATKFESGSNYRECLKLMREIVLSLDKISRNSKTIEAFRESLNKFDKELWENSIAIGSTKKYYLRAENDQGTNIVYNHFFNNGKGMTRSEITVNFGKSNKNIDRELKKSQFPKSLKNFCRKYIKLHKKSSLYSNQIDPKISAREYGKEIEKRNKDFVKKVEKLKHSNFLINLFVEYRPAWYGDREWSKEKYQSLKGLDFFDKNSTPEYFYYEVYDLPTSIESVLTTHKDDIAKDCRDFYKLD